MAFESTIISFLQRIRRNFTTRSAGESADFVAGGKAALEITQQEFESTTLYNLQQKLEATQAELERVSEELVELQQATPNRKPPKDLSSGAVQGRANSLRKAFFAGVVPVLHTLTNGRRSMLPESATEPERMVAAAGRLRLMVDLINKMNLVNDHKFFQQIDVLRLEDEAQARARRTEQMFNADYAATQQLQQLPATSLQADDLEI